MRRYREIHRTYTFRIYAPGKAVYTGTYKCKTEAELVKFVAGFQLSYPVDNWDILSVKYNYSNEK